MKGEENEKRNRKKRQLKKNNNKKEIQESKEYWKCEVTGHFRSECPSVENGELDSAEICGVIRQERLKSESVRAMLLICSDQNIRKTNRNSEQSRERALLFPE